MTQHAIDNEAALLAIEVLDSAISDSGSKLDAYYHAIGVDPADDDAQLGAIDDLLSVQLEIAKVNGISLI
jgi:hypothetical protein